mmetsp:Transcript_33211/g.43768  ORF Transcript_33211/g.43768 Transcript_33211/m.43768 type:complete len:87 (+) Transcript_33211:235-495(+)
MCPLFIYMHHLSNQNPKNTKNKITENIILINIKQILIFIAFCAAHCSKNLDNDLKIVQNDVPQANSKRMKSAAFDGIIQHNRAVGM